MTTTKLLTAALLLGALMLGTSSPATAQATTAIDPVGTFDFLATFGIEARVGTIEIREDEDGVLLGEVRLQGESAPAIVDSVAVDGSRLRILASVQNQLVVTIDLDFEDADTFTGTIAVPNDSIDIDGRRRAP